ncbi:hypothetical protein [Stutzerimonas stutzeri]|uniref:hypothetical protein n=1 Tax=Stutzerimonas stutzeri TaxID=316 RepID=UPI00265D31BB|nr:hypothetical protein [Stutzerimonas stutzeri]MCF6783370.1 hypothetical protein [Stutzerimonas stutzeri]
MTTINTPSPMGEELRSLIVRFIRTINESDRDLSRHGSPYHCHNVRGKWDRDGSHCVECDLWDQLREVAAMPQVTEQQPEPGGLDAESAEKCESCEGLTYGFPEAKWCCHCGAKLTGEYVPLLAALSAQGEDHE